jgi:hypothetical protein
MGIVIKTDTAKLRKTHALWFRQPMQCAARLASPSRARWCRKCDIAGVEPIFIPFRGDWDDAIEDAASKEAKHLFSKPESAASKPLPESVAKPRALVSQDDARGNGAEAAVGADIETGERGRPEKDANWHVLREEAAKLANAASSRRSMVSLIPPSASGLVRKRRISQIYHHPLPGSSEWTAAKSTDVANAAPPDSHHHRMDWGKNNAFGFFRTRVPPAL